jgi:radical SAM superfamily enzyme YgiQ (UPF0313 family)
VNTKAANVVLINPPTHVGRRRSLPLPLIRQRVLLRQEGVSEDFLDLQHMVAEGRLPFPKGFLEAVYELLSSRPAKLFCFHIITSGGPFAYAMMKIVHELYPEAVIAASGGQVRYLQDELLTAVPSLDVIFNDDVESVTCHLAQTVIRYGHKGLSKVPGILWRHHNVWCRGTTVKQLPIDDLPAFDQTLAQLGVGDLVSLEVGRGCRWACSFCMGKARGSISPRYKSPARVVVEAQELMSLAKQCQTGMVMFESDFFGENVEYLTHLKKERVKAEASFQYGCYCRVDYLDDRRLDLLADTGCRFVFLGVESASQRIQSNMHKNLKVSTILPLVQKLLARGIKVGCSLMIGFPEEDEDEVAATLNLAAQIVWLGASIHLGPLRVEPGSALSEQVKDQDFVLLEESEYASAIKDAGLSGKHLSPRLAFYAHAAQISRYDIRKLSNSLAGFCAVLNALPLSLYIRQRLMHKAPASILPLIPKLIQASHSSIVDVMYVLFGDQTPLAGTTIDFVLDYEALVFRTQQGCEDKAKTNTIIERCHKQYDHFRKNPSVLFTSLKANQMQHHKILNIC